MSMTADTNIAKQVIADELEFQINTANPSWNKCKPDRGYDGDSES